MHRGILLGTVLLTAWAVAAGSATSGGRPEEAEVAPFAEDAWRGVHVYFSNRDDLPLLHRAIEEVLAPHGMNVLVFEVNNGFQFASHPEVVRGGAMTKEDARALVDLCRRCGVRLIPQYQCFGHQGHRPNTFLRAHPKLMAPTEPDYSNPAHYHVSWNPLDPKTNEIVFALFDELIDAFQADALHVGMDEVFLFPDETTPHYNGESNAEIFAKAANDYHGHLVKKRGVTMLMWGDRLIDQSVMRYHKGADLILPPKL